MGTLFRACVLLSVFIAIGHLTHAQSPNQPPPSKAINETILCGKEWKLGSFEMGDGEKPKPAQIFLSTFRRERSITRF